jgi:hypothetical protein
METSEQLLEKLNRQFNAGEPAAIILRTLSALETAIRRSPPLPRVYAEEEPQVPEDTIASIPEATPQVIMEDDSDLPPFIQVLEVDEAEIEEELRALREAADLRQSRQQHLRPDLTLLEDAEVYPLDEEFHPQIPAGLHHETVQTNESIPPPSVHPTGEQSPGNLGRELNDAIAEQSSSLNDRFRTSAQGSEHPKFLTPIADLRSAIGINDRFRFVNDLFSGDGNVFTQAIHYLDHCSSYAEAVGWIENYLKSSGKWNPEHPSVRDFLQLLERRYA